jgi:hypothetical protein
VRGQLLIQELVEKHLELVISERSEESALPFENNVKP